MVEVIIINKKCDICDSEKSVYFNKKTNRYLCNAHSKQISRYSKINKAKIRQENNSFEFHENHVEMFLFNKEGEIITSAMIDLKDYDKIKVYKWYLSDNYVANVKVGKLHRYLLGVDDYSVVDHINMNTLDNRKENLRICTQQENCFNKTEYKNNSSGHRGVIFNKKNNKWRSRIGVDGKQIQLGYYHTLEEAINARIEAEKLYFGEYSPIHHKEEVLS